MSETQTFVRKVGAFFYCLNVRDLQTGQKKRKSNSNPYTSPDDPRFQVRVYYIYPLCYMFMYATYLQVGLRGWTPRVFERLAAIRGRVGRIYLKPERCNAPKRETHEGIKVSGKLVTILFSTPHDMLGM